MTDLERKTVYGLIQDTLDNLTDVRNMLFDSGQKIQFNNYGFSRPRFMDIMGTLGKSIAKLQNCVLGCPSGVHSGRTCKCKQEGKPVNKSGRGY